VLVGDYTLEILGYNDLLWIPCLNTQEVSVMDSDTIYADNAMEIITECSILEVQIAAPFIRRCFNQNYSVNYCNNGTILAENAFIVITLPDLITITNAPPHIDNGDGTYTFELGDINVGECGDFIIQTLTSCEALLGQTLCATAEIFPHDDCGLSGSNWSGASLDISANCNGNEVQFLITNIGNGDMITPTEYIVIEDGVMFINTSDPIQLNAGDSTPLTFPANGATYQVLVNQVAGHPGNSNPSLAIEGCGTNLNGGFTTGFINQFPFDDQDHFIDIDCQEVIGSWDPNDKQAFPKGYSDAHYITDSTEIDYLIRFQNTGTDTAFNIVVEDVLSEHLDITTLRPGVSSHPYNIEIIGSDTLHFVFENIMLPDSNINEPLSHGFVQFSIQPRLGTPLETLVENFADIFFDFNEAVRTNTVFHTVGEDFIIISSDHEVFLPDLEIQIVPNPFSEITRLTLQGVEVNTATLKLFDLQGKQWRNNQFSGQSIKIERKNLPKGMYFYQVEIEGRLAGVGKLIIK